jgi:hypothetical protein
MARTNPPPCAPVAPVTAMIFLAMTFSMLNFLSVHTARTLGTRAHQGSSE